MTAQTIWFAFYDLDLGKPSAACEARDGGFWRSFDKGAVAVNPTSQAVTISSPGSYRTLAGEQVEKLLLPPKQAAILLRPEAKTSD